MQRTLMIKTLREARNQILGWSLGILIPTSLLVFVFPSLPQFDIETLLNKMPSFVQQLAGDPSNFSRLEGFLKLKLFDTQLPILLAVFAIGQGAASIAGEREHRTIDFLLAQPISRRRIVLEKFSAILIGLCCICLVLFAGTAGSAWIMHLDLNFSWLALTFVAILPLLWVFAAVALFASCLYSKVRHASMLASAFLIWSFFLEMLRMLLPSLSFLKHFSLFYHYTHFAPLEGGIHFQHLAVLLGVLAVLLIASVAAFDRRDVTV